MPEKITREAVDKLLGAAGLVALKASPGEGLTLYEKDGVGRLTPVLAELSQRELYRFLQGCLWGGRGTTDPDSAP